MDLSFQGLCHRLYDFIKRCLATYAMKSATLGQSSSDQASAPPSEDASLQDKVEPSAQLSPPSEDASLQDKVELDPADEHTKVEEKGDGSISSAPCEEEQNEEEAAMSATQAQPPKKMVSIKDTVEELVASKKKSKKKKRREEMGSVNNQEIDEPKPLKSILKVGSKQDEDSNTNPGTTLGST